MFDTDDGGDAAACCAKQRETPIVASPSQSNIPQQARREIIPSTDESPSWIKRGIAAVVAAGAVGAGAYGIGYLKTKGEVDALKDASGGNTTTSAPSIPGDVRTEKYPSRLPITDVTGDQFVGVDTMYPYTYTRQEQLDYAGVELNTNMQATAARMRERAMGTQNTTFFAGDTDTSARTVVKPSLDNSPQQIWDQITVGTFQAWEAAQNGNIDEAKKLAAVVADPEDREYTDQLKTFTNANALSIAPDGVAWNEQPVIANGEYEGIQATPTAPLIEFNVNIGGNDTGNRIKAVLRFEQGSNPDANRWVLVSTHDA